MSVGPRPAATEIARRLTAAGIAIPRAESVVVDLACDPPLGRSARTLAVEEPARLVEGLGAAMIVARARRGVVAVRDAAGKRAIEAALSSLSAAGAPASEPPASEADASAAPAVRVILVAPVWPSVGIDRDVGCEDGLVLDGERVLDVEAAAFQRPRAPRRVTIAGAVHRPGVYPLAPSRNEAGGLSIDASIASTLVDLAGGASALSWVALDGGAYGGRLVEREDPVRSSLLLVLPAAHPLIARARVSVADHLRRVASACEGCRACTDACPVFLDGGALAPDRLVAALSSGTVTDVARDGGSRLAQAAACVSCGVCDAACPSGLSPFALVGAFRERLRKASPPVNHDAAPSLPSSPRARGAAHPDRQARRVGLDVLLLRAGLGDEDSAARDPAQPSRSGAAGS